MMLVSDFSAAPVEEALRKLDTSLETGLTSDEAKKRLAEVGHNEVPEKKKNAALSFLKRFWGLTAWTLELTILISYVLGRPLDLIVIAALLIVNAVLGFAQEWQAERAVEALKQKLSIRARVLRDGGWSIVPARELVPGDVVRVRAGDFVPADVKIIDGEVEVDQSALTGESLPAGKKAGDILYSGSLAKKGEATGVTILTGTRTYFGRAAQLVQVARPKLYVETVITGLLERLLALVIVLLSLAFVASYLRGVSLLGLLPLALVLLVSSIPVALPAMFTVTMALGSLELAKKGVLVTRLSASQDAAMMDILCADKTGTITMNRLSVAYMVEIGSHSEDDVALYGALASQEANQDPIDLAFIAEARRKGLSLEGYAQKKFTPFDPSTRRTEATIEKDGEEFTVVKGAALTIAGLCNIGGAEIADIEARVDSFAKKGYRVVAVAKGGMRGFELVGMTALHDPPRPDSAKLIDELRGMGISTKMLTGDSLPIAREVAKEVGIGENISGMEGLKGMGINRARDAIEKSDGFAGVYPEDKYLIVKALQAKKHVVGMTGDGVNDAPALKQAEVGIAVSSATDVARGAASVVLTEEGLHAIVSLVRVGRMIHQRIVTWILNKIIKTFEIVVFVVAAYLITGVYVVGAFEIVLLLFLIDFVTISIAADNARPSLRPETWELGPLVKASVLLGVLMVSESLALLYIAIRLLHLTDATGLRTFTFCMLIFGGLFTIFMVRERGYFWNSRPSNILLAAIGGDMLVTTIVSVFGIPGLMPIPLAYVLIAWAWYLLFALLINDAMKVRVLRLR
ncbi:plasma-membrane proton-efflux P-type ATPase [Methanocella conradii]|uniref:plasma-membrane proton-efflux P-type ATPase n=1 Tax=Methanocella conradii TaxID=1175444 RepID=UPI0024B33DC2|nr:plasma-membrane proton-efflux P-type ATPase [Methanocella conradii]MDI6896594.1 plasma-membrane proton-efflux P-type ATPase [Methanocella conradii]